MNGKGFIIIPRNLLNDWRDRLTAEEQGIMVNLMAMANYEDKPKKAPKGDTLHRGQLVTSIRSFAKRFGISESRAYRMLRKWERLGLISRETKNETLSETGSGTLLTLEFYESSQCIRNDLRNSLRNENGNTIKKDNNLKKEEEAPPFPLYGSYHNISLTEDELKELQMHIPADLFESRINKASQGIRDKWRGYQGSHFEIIKKWAIEDGCWEEQADSQRMNKICKMKMDLIDQFGRDKYDRAVATINIDDPYKVRRYLESKCC